MLDFTKVMLRQGNEFFDSNGNLHHQFLDIGFGVMGADAAALVVDPTNPNVVYVGGSREFTDQLGRPTTPTPPVVGPALIGADYQHSFIRVDTGNMRDTDYVVPLGILHGGTIWNDGDDISKVIQAAFDD